MAVHLWAHIEADVCDNVILLDADANPDWDLSDMVDLGPEQVPGMPWIGWNYDGTNWTPPSDL